MRQVDDGAAEILRHGAREQPVADDDGFATDLAMGTIGVIVADEMATSNDMGPMTADTSIIATHAQTGTAATAGEGYVWIEYMPNA